MTHEQFVKVVFKGEVVLGKDRQKVKEDLAHKFSLQSDAIDRLFSGKKITVKKNIKRREALKYRDAFRQAGAICNIEWMDPEYVEKVMELDSESVLKIVTCPKCGLKQDTGEICEFCGYALKVSLHSRDHFFRLIYDTMREKGIPKWMIFLGLGILFFGLILPMFLPRKTHRIPSLSNRDISGFIEAAVPQGYPIFQWNFSGKNKMNYDFERVYTKDTSLNAYNPYTDEAQSESADPMGSRGRVIGQVTIKSSGDSSALIHLHDASQTVEYNNNALNIYKPVDADVLPGMANVNLSEAGNILSAVSSDFVFFHLLFRTPESIQQIGDTEVYDVNLSYMGKEMTGEGEVQLEAYVLIEDRVCAKLSHDIELTSGEDTFEGNHYNIRATMSSFLDMNSRMLLMVQLKQDIFKKTYQMKEGFYAWVTFSQQETITLMQEGLAENLPVIKSANFTPILRP